MKTFCRLLIGSLLIIIATFAQAQTISVIETLSKDGFYFRESYTKKDHYFTRGKLSKKEMLKRIDFNDKSLVKRSIVDRDTIKITLIDSSYDGYLAILDMRMKNFETNFETNKVDSSHSRLVQTVHFSFDNSTMDVIATVDSLCFGDIQMLKEMFENIGTINLNGSVNSYTVGKKYQFPVMLETQDNNGDIMTLDEMLTKKLVKADGENLFFDQTFESKLTGEIDEGKCKTVQLGEGYGFETIEISTGIRNSELYKTEFSILECYDALVSNIFLENIIFKEGFMAYEKK